MSEHCTYNLPKSQRPEQQSRPPSEVCAVSRPAEVVGAVVSGSGDSLKSSGDSRNSPAENTPPNDPYFLIHGNKASTPLFMGLQEASEPQTTFDDFNPDFSFQALRDRLNRYGDAHGRALKMADWIKTNVEDLRRLDLGSVRSDLENCGSHLAFRFFYTVNQVKLSSICTCKRHLLCPLCAIRRAAKSVKAYYERFLVLSEQHPNVRPYLVTFTVKDGPDLDERFDHLSGSLRVYYAQRRKSMRGKSRHCPVEANKALGGVGSFEVKKGSGSGEWHPHSHWIWLCETLPSKQQIQQEWHDRTGDSFIVDVTPFHGGDVASGFLEVFKYALKYSSMTHADNWEAFLSLRGRRLVSSFGIFRGVEVPEQDTDEISLDDLPFYEMVFKYIAGSYSLQNVTKTMNKSTD